MNSSLLIAATSECTRQKSFQNSFWNSSQSRNFEYPLFFSSCYVSVTHVNSISVSIYHVTFLSTNSVLRCTTVGYHIISIPLFTQTFLQDSPSYSQVLPYVNTIWPSSVDINSDSLLFISTLDFAFQGMGMHGTIFNIYHMFIPCLRNSL